MPRRKLGSGRVCRMRDVEGNGLEGGFGRFRGNFPRTFQQLPLLALANCLAMLGCSTESIQRDIRQIHADAASMVWIAQSGGKLRGSDMHKKLGYPSTQAMPTVELNGELGRQRVSVESSRIDLSGEHAGPTNFGDLSVPSGTLSSDLAINYATALYGWRFGGEMLSAAPEAGLEFDSSLKSLAHATGGEPPPAMM